MVQKKAGASSVSVVDVDCLGAGTREPGFNGDPQLNEDVARPAYVNEPTGRTRYAGWLLDTTPNLEYTSIRPGRRRRVVGERETMSPSVSVDTAHRPE